MSSSQEAAPEKTASAAPSATASAPDTSARDSAVAKRIALVDSLMKGKLPPTVVAPTVDTSGPKPVITATQEDPNVNAAVEPLDHLPGLGMNVQLPEYDDGDIHYAAAFVRGKKEVGEKNSLDLEGTAAKRYLAIIRVTKRVEARVTGPNKFIPGTCVGDALVFDFESGKQVAAVPMAGQNSDEVTQHMDNVKADVYLKQNLDRACVWSAQLHINAAYEKAGKK